jgi:hypothetical protein
MTVKERIDEGLDRIRRLGAKAVRIVLTEADLAELRDQAGAGEAYGGVPVGQGEIGGHSYIETEGAPSGDTNFAI